LSDPSREKTMNLGEWHLKVSLCKVTAWSGPGSLG
jgi:hypothetical protein